MLNSVLQITAQISFCLLQRAALVERGGRGWKARERQTQKLSKATAVTLSPAQTQRGMAWQMTNSFKHVGAVIYIYAWELHLEGYCHPSISNSWVFCLRWQKSFRGNYLPFYRAVPSTVRAERTPQISPDNLDAKGGNKNPILSSWVVCLPFICCRRAQKARSNEKTTYAAGESSLFFSFCFPLPST